jgi:PleD family two-component response regulator
MDHWHDTTINGVPIASLSTDELYEIVRGRRLEWARPEPAGPAERELDAAIAAGEPVDVLVAHSYEGDTWRFFLEDHGYRCAVAANLEQVLKCVKVLKPKLVMTHALFGMLKGPGPDELMKTLRADPETASIKILMYTMSRDAKELYPGADAYLFSPVNMNELIGGIAWLTGKRAKKKS